MYIIDENDNKNNQNLFIADKTCTFVNVSTITHNRPEINKVYYDMNLRLYSYCIDRYQWPDYKDGSCKSTVTFFIFYKQDMWNTANENLYVENMIWMNTKQEI